jgi:hypothetical protein
LFGLLIGLARFFIGIDDAGDQGVAHNVSTGEAAEGNPLDAF